MDDDLDRAARGRRLAVGGVVGQGEWFLAQGVAGQDAERCGAVGVAVEIGQLVGDAGDGVVEGEAVGGVELGPQRHVALLDLAEGDVPAGGRPLFAFGGCGGVGQDDPAVELAHDAPEGLLGQRDGEVPVQVQAGLLGQPGGVAGLGHLGGLPRPHRAGDEGLPQPWVAVAQVEHGGDLLERGPDRDLEGAGDLGGDELPDVRGALGAALHPAFGALDQEGVIDLVCVAQRGDRQALGDLAGAFLGGGVAQRCGRIGQSVGCLVHNMILLAKRR